MMFEEQTPLHLPELQLFEERGLTYIVDGAAPNWAVLESAGRDLLQTIRQAPAPLTAGKLATRHAAARGLSNAKAWLHVHDFLQGLHRARFLSDAPISVADYPGRLAVVQPEGLRELWLQLNNNCNLSCSHCLVGSGPGKEFGLPLEKLIAIVDRGVELGLERLYITGGEPFVRRDIFALLKHATDVRGLEVIVLTNGTVFQGPVKAGILELDRARVHFQVSIDGARAETNDPIRGMGTFERALRGVRFLSEAGFDVSITTVTTRENLPELIEIPQLVQSLGAKSQHLMWAHKRGRAATSLNGFFPECGAITSAVLGVADAAERLGTVLDNLEIVKRRVNGVPGLKYDFGNGGWDSLCVNFDGLVYPTPALANERSLLCGDATRVDLADILAGSPVVRQLREATVARKPSMRNDPFRFLTGGGDWEHAWTFSGGDPLAPDPYYAIQTALVRRVMTTLGQEKATRRNRQSGYDAPVVLHTMGEGAIACGTADGRLAEQPVLTLHSNCVLSFDVDRPRAKVREYYQAAAEQPQPDLCCPTSYDPGLVSHIPQDVIDRFYGCGSPIALAGVRAGECVVDLGSGAGIDVFIAAKLAGREGSAIGVDMTDAMLTVAKQNRPLVAAALGFDNVDFRKGYLEQIPVEDRSVDLVTSNCVINLSPDKPRVFEEAWRILRDHGRIVLSDIVSEREVPPHLKVNPELWGECLVGALTEAELLAQLERAGFHGLTVLRKSYWKDVEGYPFYSITVRGYKYAKSASCVFQGHQAIYLGPGKGFLDEEGHLFPRNEAIEICTDSLAKLTRAPYDTMFAVLQPGEARAGYVCCGPDGTCC